MVTTIDMPTLARERVIAAAQDLGLTELAEFASQPHNCYDEIARHLLRLPSDVAAEFGNRVLRGLLPNSETLVQRWQRLVELDPYAVLPNQDVSIEVSDYLDARGANADRIDEVENLDGIVAGARTLRAMHSDFKSHVPMLDEAIARVRDAGLFDFLALPGHAASARAVEIGNSIASRESLSLPVANCIHRQLLQITQGTIADIILTGQAGKVFGSLREIYQKGCVPIGTEGKAFLVYHLAR